MMKRWTLAAVLLALPMLMGADDPAEETLPPDVEAKLLLGPFEGHGLAQPKNAKKAKKARALAQRLAQRCTSIGERRGGGSQAWGAKCKTRKVRKDDVPAMLDRLNDVSVNVGQFWTIENAFEALLFAAVDTGREDTITPMITALDRLALRIQYGDLFTVELNDVHRFKVVEAALTRLTYHRVERKHDGQHYPVEIKVETLSDQQVIAKWRAWHKAHADKSRDEWRKAAIAKARARATDDEMHVRVFGINQLRDIPRAKAEAMRRARKLIKEHPELEAGLYWAKPRKR